MMDLYAILDENKKTTNIVDYAVPLAYTPDSNTVTFPAAPVGRYNILYNFEAYFNGVKNIPLEWIITVNGTDSPQFSEVAPDRTAENHRNRLYGREFDHTVIGDIVMAINFQDPAGNGFVVTTCDITIQRAG